MTDRPRRIVDAHVHLWDPERADWYPYLSRRSDVGLGDVTGMSRRFDVDTYRSEATGWNVVKLVNVAAATGDHSIEETLELDRRAGADGMPDALIGGITPSDTPADALAQIERQMTASRFRGIRPMGVFDGPLPAAEVLSGLRERSLVFELMAHPDQLRAAADGLSRAGDLSVVVEHAGWPRSDTPEEWELWSDGMAALADLGDNVVCKLSGLAMPLGSMSVDAFRPWVERSLELFGTDRCMFASNFPVDGLHGTLDQLFTAYLELTAALTAEDRDKLFATNAERVYRC